MHAAGIIAEYNPFHNGHAYHAAQTRKSSGADAVIAVMSGHVTQRGEIAIFDKWQRAGAAVAAGVDLVLELPAVFAVRSAQYFATGGVQLLQRLGIVATLAFGAEAVQPEQLYSAASALDEPAVTAQLKSNLTQGLPYAAALADALIACGHTTADIIKSPNNILGIEYLRAIRKQAPEMAALPIRRIGSHYHEPELTGTYSSATAIRNGLRRGLPLTDAVLAALPATSSRMALDLLASGWGPADPVRLEVAILSTLRRLSDRQLQVLPELSEGLENRLRNAADRAGTLTALLTQVKSKRYPYSRLQRILAHLLLGTTADQLADFDQTGPLYARVLALNSRGRVALRHIARHSEIPIITKTTQHLNSRIYHGGNFTPLQAMLAVDVAATDLFSLCLPAAENRKGGLDFCRSAFHIG